MSAQNRLVQIDGLRGIAAVLVLLFHVTTRYDIEYIHNDSLPFTVPWGSLGVHLFFAISGFVILMTLRRTRVPSDFVISRVSRLYPTYWVAVLLSTIIVLAAGLPGHQRSMTEVAANLLMFHGLFGIDNVDGAYWSLEVELIFYVWMLLLWSFGWLGRPMRIVVAWLAVSLAARLAATFGGIELPWTIAHLTLMKWIPWFSIGISVYVIAHAERDARLAQAAMLMAVLVVGVGDGWGYALWAACVTTGLLLAALGRVRLLGTLPFAFFGAISYPLYLIHENLSFSLMLHAEHGGLHSSLAAALAILVSIVVAWLLHRTVETHGTEALRRWWRSKRGAPGAAAQTYPRWAAALIVLFMVVAVGMRLSGKLVATRAEGAQQQKRELLTRAQSRVTCHSAGDSTHAWLIVDDLPDPAPTPAQHGSGATAASECSDDDPGLSHLLRQFAPASAVRPRLIALHAPDLRAEDLAELSSNDFAPMVTGLVSPGQDIKGVIWQQTRADAAGASSAQEYADGVRRWVRKLRGAGITAPVYVARDGVCRGDRFGVLARAQSRLADSALGVVLGPDFAPRSPADASADCLARADAQRMAAERWIHSTSLYQ